MAGTSYADPPQIWFNVMEPVWRDIKGWPQNDFHDLIDKNQWPTALQAIGVFQFTEKYAAHGDSDELASIIKLLNAHKVKIAIQGIALIASQRCGLGIEGYGTTDETLRSATRLVHLGAKLSYVTFDEPLYYGHFFSGYPTRRSCHLSVEAVATQVAERTAALRAAFPGVLVGEVEPFGLTDVDPNRWAETYASWLDIYQRTADRQLDFVQADIVWNRSSWIQQLSLSLQSIKKHDLPYGVLFTDSSINNTDSGWATNVIKNIKLFEATELLPPKQVVFASWTDYPRRLTPDSAPNTMTGVIARYAARRR